MTSTETSCQQFRKLWQDELDECGYPPTVAPHLESCELCRIWVREMSALLGNLDELRTLTSGVVSSRPAAPRTARDRHGPFGSATSRRRLRLWLPAAAGLAASIILALMMVPLGDEDVSLLTNHSGAPKGSATRTGAGDDTTDRGRGGAIADASSDASVRPRDSLREQNESAARSGITLRGESDSQLMAVAQTQEVSGVAVYLLYRRIPRGAPGAVGGGS